MISDGDAVRLLTNTDNASKSTLKNSNNALDVVNNNVVVDDSAGMSFGSTTSCQPPRTEVNKICFRSEKGGELSFPLVVDDVKNTSVFLRPARGREAIKVEPISISVLKERSQITSYQHSLIKECRSFIDEQYAPVNAQPKQFPWTFWKNKNLLIFPVGISTHKVEVVKSGGGEILAKIICDGSTLGSLFDKQEDQKFPMVYKKSILKEFPLEVASLKNIQTTRNVLDRPILIRPLLKFRLTNKAKQMPGSSIKQQRSFPIQNQQQQSKDIAHFPYSHIKIKNISHSRTEFNQNNPADDNNQKQTSAQEYEKYTEIAAIDDNNERGSSSQPPPPAIMTQSENSSAAKYGNVRIIQVHTTKHSTSGQCKSNDGSSSAQNQQEQFLHNTAAVLPASNTKNNGSQLSYTTEYNNFNICKTVSGDALLSGQNIKIERLVSILKSFAPTTITPTIGENLENFEYEEQQQQYSSHHNDHLDHHHHHHQRKTHRQCSDDRDTSSEEVLVLVEEIPTTSETCPSKSLRSVNSTHQQQQLTTSFFPSESTPALDIVPNFESVPSRVERNGCNCTEVLIDRINARQVGDESLNEQQQPETSENCVQSRERIEMTVTKVNGDSEESSQILSDNQKIIIDETIDEMKFEMKSVKGALPSAAIRSTHLRNEQNMPNVVGTRSSNPSSVAPAYGSSAAFSSLDLPRFGKASSEVSLRSHEVAGGRSLSLDTADSLLPERTRLRRQRRMLSQDSTAANDQPEDPIERLNRLRARISGALTEVKGVLKQYSTETETEGDGQATTANTARRTEPPTKVAEEPVTFRFVRKVRRRSFFDEAEEDKEKKMEAVKVGAETEKVKGDLVKVGTEVEQFNGEIVSKAEIEKVKDDTNKSCLKSIEENKEIYLNQEPKPLEKHEPPISEASQVTENKETNETIVELTTDEVESVNTDAVPKSDANDSKKPNEMKLLDVVSEEKSSHCSESERSANELITSDVTSNMVIEKMKIATGTVNKPKRKAAVIKIKDSSRRASIAAVELSKIEPPVNSTAPLVVKAQRRPSDSEAVVKKKVIVTPKTTTSDLNGEATKQKFKTITRVKRPSVKSDGSAVNAIVKQQSLTKINAIVKQQSLTKVNEKAAATTAITSLISKSDDGSGDTITEANNSNKDAVPIAPTTTTAKTIATAPPQPAILQTQLVINDASLTIPKTTEATAVVAPPQDEATKDSRTATKLDEQNDAPMVATLASSLRASEQNGGQSTNNTKQLTVLVGETIIIVPTTTIKSANQLKQSGNTTVDSNQIIETKISEKDSKVKISDKKLVPVEKIPSPETILKIAEKVPDESTEIPETRTSAQVADENDIDIKKPINQKPISADLLQQEQPTSQQVASAANVIPVVVPPTQIEKSDATPQIATATSETDVLSVIIDEATKASSTPTTSNSTEQTTASGTSVASTAKKEEETIQTEAANMPELQVLQMPVKAVQVFGDHHQPQEPAPFNVTHKDEFTKKKVIIKKLVRKNSTDKTNVNSKPNTVQTTKDKSKTQPQESVVSNETQLVLDDASRQELSATAADDELITAEETEEAEAAEALETILVEEPKKPKKPRTVKKKVIIRRQQRKLSISDTFFNAPEVDDQKQPPPEIDTVERAIAYVTDDESDDDEPKEPPKPLKTCIKLREYQVGDWVMYAERFKKTQVRWKKGRVIERITSISYLLDIDGKAVPAHISYIKKYTDRKVNFGGKEYLEIDYEQIAIEEQKARSYSIWNMV